MVRDGRALVHVNFRLLETVQDLPYVRLFGDENGYTGTLNSAVAEVLG